MPKRPSIIRTVGERLFINLFSPGKGWLMLIVWLFMLYAGFFLVTSFTSTQQFLMDYSSRAIVGILVIYCSLSAIFWKLVANNVL